MFVVDLQRHNDGEDGIVGPFRHRDEAERFIAGIEDRHEQEYATIRPVQPNPEDEPHLLNSHFPDSPKIVRPDVRVERIGLGGPTHVYLNGERVRYPIVYNSVSFRREAMLNILTLSFIVGNVSMDSTPRPEGVG